MLVSARIFSFRTCKNVFIRGLQAPLVLLGRNGAGKTNILKAIAWAASGASVMDEESNFRSENGHVELTFKIAGKRYVYTVQRWTEMGEVGKPVVRVSESLVDKSRIKEPGRDVFRREDSDLSFLGTSALKVPLGASALPLAFALTKTEDPLFEPLGAIQTFCSGVIYYPILTRVGEPGKSIHQGTDYDEWKKRARHNFESDSDLSLALVDAYITRKEKYDEIHSILGPDGLGVINEMNVFDLKTGSEARSRRFMGVFFTPNGADPDDDLSGVTLDQLSMGTRRVVQLITHLILDRITVALIEQPEDAIHPALLRKLMSVINSYSSEFQFIIASHAPDVFNCMSPKQVRLVELKDGRTYSHALSIREVATARDYMENSGSLSDFLESM